MHGTGDLDRHGGVAVPIEDWQNEKVQADGVQCARVGERVRVADRTDLRPGKRSEISQGVFDRRGDEGLYWRQIRTSLVRHEGAIDVPVDNPGTDRRVAELFLMTQLSLDACSAMHGVACSSSVVVSQPEWNVEPHGVEFDPEGVGRYHEMGHLTFCCEPLKGRSSERGTHVL